MYDVRYNFTTFKVTQTLEEAIVVASGMNKDVNIYDYKTNRLLFEWSPITGLKQFLVD
jgi:hypothetical protein